MIRVIYSSSSCDMSCVEASAAMKSSFCLTRFIFCPPCLGPILTANNLFHDNRIGKNIPGTWFDSNRISWKYAFGSYRGISVYLVFFLNRITRKVGPVTCHHTKRLLHARPTSPWRMQDIHTAVYVTHETAHQHSQPSRSKSVEIWLSRQRGRAKKKRRATPLRIRKKNLDDMFPRP